jgi:hypothetical protein
MNELLHVSGELAVADPEPITLRFINHSQGVALRDGGTNQLNACQESHTAQSLTRLLRRRYSLVYLWRKGFVPLHRSLCPLIRKKRSGRVQRYTQCNFARLRVKVRFVASETG